MRLNYSTSTCSNLPRIMKQIETDWNHMNIWTSLVFTQVCFGIAKSHVTHFSCPKLDDEISRSAGLRDNLLDSSPFAAYSLDLPRNAQAVGPFFVLPKPPAAGNCFVCWIWGICLKNRVWQNWGELHCHTERLQCEYVSAECSLPFGMFIPWLFIGISNHFFRGTLHVRIAYCMQRLKDIINWYGRPSIDMAIHCTILSFFMIFAIWPAGVHAFLFVDLVWSCWMIFFLWCMQGCFVSHLQRVSRVKPTDAGHLDHSSRARIARTCLALAQWCGCHRWKGAAVEERVRFFGGGYLFCCLTFVKRIPFQFVMKEMQMHYIQRIMSLGTGLMCTI